MATGIVLLNVCCQPRKGRSIIVCNGNNNKHVIALKLDRNIQNTNIREIRKRVLRAFLVRCVFAHACVKFLAADDTHFSFLRVACNR
jgi:hypothetical protein